MEELIKQAEQGDARAQFRLGMAYYNGDMIEKSVKPKHLDILEKSARPCVGIQMSKKSELLKMESTQKNKFNDTSFELLLVLLMILLLPFELIYKFAEHLKFKKSRQKRSNEYRRMMLGRAKTPIRLEQEVPGFFRNKEKLVEQFCSSEHQYPNCEVYFWIPKMIVEKYPSVPWMMKTVYSVRVPYTFHCHYTNGSVSSLLDYDWLLKFQHVYHLTNAVPVINYTRQTDWGRELLKKSSNILDDEEYDEIECFVELLTETEPMEGLEYEKIDYMYYHAGTFQLKRHYFDILTTKSYTTLKQTIEKYHLK